MENVLIVVETPLMGTLTTIAAIPHKFVKRATVALATNLVRRELWNLSH